ncbi:DNA methylase [Tissierella sp. P1]|uniref:DNA-methyltransferase n=1 Tax=Tissierella sp. P1 TaxID=1280483 RepID=UPI000BA004EF|nr:DNA methyltransferase [Tissierella sp. P1]OZV12317.1 DNA methylase [Tissierella sp. P1]
MTKQYQGENFSIYNGDCVRIIKEIPDNSVHFPIFSPPFANLYIYSDDLADMGNCKDIDEFFEQFDFLIPELYRITKPGRLCAVHCKQLVKYKGRDGRAGLTDFRGKIIEHFERSNWQYHSEVCIWTDPVLEMQKTKAHGLLYKQVRKDASFSRQGLADYLVIFRKWAEEDEEDLIEPVEHTKEDFPLPIWQRYASPVWMDIQRTNVLNVQQAKEDKDEKHICPLQLDVIERAIDLWTNPGDIVFSPFLGIGSEIYMAVKMGRKGIGIELKEKYFEDSYKNIIMAVQESNQVSIFDVLEKQ